MPVVLTVTHSDRTISLPGSQLESVSTYDDSEEVEGSGETVRVELTTTSGQTFVLGSHLRCPIAREWAEEIVAAVAEYTADARLVRVQVGGDGFDIGAVLQGSGVLPKAPRTR